MRKGMWYIHGMKKLIHKSSSNQILQKKDILALSKKIDRNQKALDQLDGMSQKIDRNQKALNILIENEENLKLIGPTFKILQENEENLKQLGTLHQRLDTLDKIMVTVDKMAGSMQTYQQEIALLSPRVSTHTDDIEKIDKRVEEVEKLLHISLTQ